MSEIIMDAIAANSSQVVEHEGESILVCNSGGQHYAIKNQCTHQDSPLEKGRVRNGYISCPLHGVRFSLETGAPMGVELTRTPIQTFPVITEPDGIRIVVSEDTN